MNNIPLYYHQIKKLIDYYGEFLLDSWDTKPILSQTGETLTREHLQAVIEYDIKNKKIIDDEEAVERKERLQKEYNFGDTLHDLFNHDESPFIK